jgi:hypothetical protein
MYLSFLAECCKMAAKCYDSLDTNFRSNALLRLNFEATAFCVHYWNHMYSKNYWTKVQNAQKAGYI